MDAKEQKLFVEALMSKKGDITIALPDKMKSVDIHESLQACCRAFNGVVERAAGKLKPIIGRLLVMAKENPDTYTTLGYKTFEDYSNAEVRDKLGLSRSNIWESKRLIEKWPSLELETYGRLGVGKLLLLAKVTAQSETGHKKLLEAADKRTFDQLKDYLVEKGYLGKDEADGGVLRLTGSKAQVKKLKGFLGDEDAQGYFETEVSIEMILAAFEESSSQWAQGKAAKAS